MAAMFMNSKTASIDLSDFDTSNITNMMGTFAISKATEIKGLNKFDTSNVKYMGGMFANTKVPILDLSSFNLSNLSLDMDDTRGFEGMLIDCAATKGYARTEEDLQFLNNALYTSKPDTLVFELKQ